MRLNCNNGAFQLDEYSISPQDKISDLKKKFSNDRLEIWIENNEWITYRLDTSSKFILMIRFFKNVMHLIEVFPKSYSDGQRRKDLLNYLEILGGENKYRWGKVELNEDEKAGYESIVINYHD